MSDLEYIEPDSLEGVLAQLDPDDPAVRPISGGTALMLMMKAGLYRPRRLVSLRRAGNGFDSFTRNADRSSFRIGALTTFAQLEHSPEICDHFPVISRAMKTLANVRVRNVATVGGNLAHADPHLDLPPIWVALDATALIVSARGERIVPVADIFAGYYETTIANDELVAEIDVPIRPSWRSRYVKVTTRAVHDWPALGLAFSLDFDGTKARDLRLVFSAAVDRPVRLLRAEDALRGKPVDDASLTRAVDACLGEVDIESDSRGSSDYKKHLLAVHFRRTLDAMVAEKLQ